MTDALVRLSEVDQAAIASAVFHRKRCEKCSRPRTVSPRAMICLAGVMHFAKVCDILDKVAQLPIDPRIPAEVDTP